MQEKVASNYDELRFFTGLRPSGEIALVVSDYDAACGVLSITGEDRRIRLCRRAITVIQRQLRVARPSLRSERDQL